MEQVPQDLFIRNRKRDSEEIELLGIKLSESNTEHAKEVDDFKNKLNERREIFKSMEAREKKSNGALRCGMTFIANSFLLWMSNVK